MARWLRVLVAFGMLTAVTAAQSQPYPSKTITIIMLANQGSALLKALRN